MFDVPPPDNDDEAFKLGQKIRRWIKDGKPEPSTTTVATDEANKVDKEYEDEEEIHKHDKEEPKKKKSRFGFFRK